LLLLEHAMEKKEEESALGESGHKKLLRKKGNSPRVDGLHGCGGGGGGGGVGGGGVKKKKEIPQRREKKKPPQDLQKERPVAVGKGERKSEQEKTRKKTLHGKQGAGQYAENPLSEERRSVWPTLKRQKTSSTKKSNRTK